MAQQTINVGAAPNDGTGTPLRTAFQYTNSNFSELYTALGGGSGLPGSSSQVIFNDGGTNLAGDSGLVFNKTTDTLQTGALVVPGNVQLATVSTLYVGTLLNPKLKVDVGGTGVTTITEATITGDLTVDTSTLKVDSTNNRVGIGTATLFGDLNIQNGSNCRFEVTSQAGGTTIENLNNARNAYLNMTMFADAYIWNRLGSEAMRLNSTGLGVGVSPTNKLTIGTGTFNADTVSGSSSLYSTVSNGLVILADGLAVATRAGVNRMLVDTSGNIISYLTSTAPSLTDNGFMVFNLTSNTNLRISVRGSDGVTRTANITLA